jgi:sugar O-acyltransferase (sialic acid O-acetyltransferase NeuD family)
MGKPLVLIGNSLFAEIAYEYFTYDSEYDVVAFSVESEFLNNDRCCGLPVVPFEELEQHFSPSTHAFYAALVYTQGNKLRQRLYESAKEKGYTPASYISSRAFVWRNAKLGEHCFVFEDNTVQPFARLGDNVVLWSGNHIGHHSVVHSHCFVSSHVVISGNCEIGERSFLGVNATLGNDLEIGADCIVGASASVLKSVPERHLVIGSGKTKALTQDLL